MTQETKQNFLDRVIQHFAEQQKQALEAGSCRHRTKDGLKCAIGAFIPVDLYDPTWEGQTLASSSFPSACTESENGDCTLSASRNLQRGCSGGLNLGG